MTCAENIKFCCRQHRFDEDVESSAANQTCVVFWVMVQVEGEGSWLLGFHDLTGGLPDFSFNAAAAHGPEDGAIVTNEHLCGFKRRNGTAHIDDGGDCGPAAVLPQADNFFVDIHRVLF